MRMEMARGAETPMGRTEHDAEFFPLSRDDQQLLSPAMEDYLEAIFRVTERNGACSVSDVAEALDVKRPSVSKAIKRLTDAGFVAHEPYGKVSLTAKGRAVGRQQVRMHQVLMHFLVDILQLPPDLAEHDACLMEHAISRATVERLVEFIERFDAQNPDRQTLPDMSSATAPAKSPPPHRSWKSRV